MKNASMVMVVTMTVSARRVRPRPTPHPPLPLPWPVLTATKARRMPPPHHFLIPPPNLVAPQAIGTHLLRITRPPLRKNFKVTATILAKNQHRTRAGQVRAAAAVPRMAIVVVNLTTKLQMYPVLLPML